MSSNPPNDSSRASAHHHADLAMNRHLKQAQGELSIVDQFLYEQAQITPVEVFSNHHDQLQTSSNASLHKPNAYNATNSISENFDTAPDQARYYQDLIPNDRPGPGQQYAFEVDLDACSGCKGCVAACHNLNGLEETESWRDVGHLVGNTPSGYVNQPITTACHHCVEPGCLQGCPVNAYDKDPISGIVRHLDDQCFGCQYCQFKCPYDVPKYSSKLGIVRKCDMCIGRLEEGEAPACVQACPTQAIKIRLVNTQDAKQRASQDQFLPGIQSAPKPTITTPTTVFKTTRELEQTTPINANILTPEHAHTPLILMLVLTQTAVGVLCVFAVLSLIGASGFESNHLNWSEITQSFGNAGQSEPLSLLGKTTHFAQNLWQHIGQHITHSPVQTVMALTILLTGAIGIGSSLLHLGRPLLAYRAFLNLAHSWLSREAVAFGIWAKITALYLFIAIFAADIGSSIPQYITLVSAVGLGLFGIYASFMLYYDTPRPFWKHRQNLAIFGLTALSVGSAFALFAGVISAISSNWDLSALGHSWGIGIGATWGISTLIQTLIEYRIYSQHRKPTSTIYRSALLMAGPLKSACVLRLVTNISAMTLGILGLFLISNTIASGGLAPLGAALIIIGSATALLSSFTERYVFFSAVVRPKMPGYAVMHEHGGLSMTNPSEAVEIKTTNNPQPLPAQNQAQSDYDFNTESNSAIGQEGEIQMNRNTKSMASESVSS